MPHIEQQKESKKQTVNTFKSESIMNDTKVAMSDMCQSDMTEAEIEAREKSFLQKEYLKKNGNKLFLYSMRDRLNMFEYEYAAQKKAQKDAKLKKEKAAK